MMYNTSPELLAKRLSDNMQDVLTDAIKTELNKQVQPILQEIAVKLAKGLKGSITTFSDYRSGEVKISLTLDGITDSKIY